MVKILLSASFRHYFRDNFWFTFLSLFSLAVAVACIIVVDSTSANVSKSIQEAEQFLNESPKYKVVSGYSHIDQRIYVDLVKLGYTDVLPWISGNIKINDRKFAIIGIDPFSLPGRSTVSEGSISTDLDIIEPNTVLVHPDTAFKLHETLEIEIEVGEGGQARHSARVVGYLPKEQYENKSWIVADIGTAQKILKRKGQIDKLFFLDEKTEHEESQIRNAVNPALLVIEEQVFDTARHFLNSYTINLNAMSLLIVFVALLLFYNTISISYMQRQNDLSLYYTLGIRERLVERIYILEVLAMLIVAIIAGLALGVLLTLLILQVLPYIGADGYQFNSTDAFSLGYKTWLKILFLVGLSLLTAFIVPKKTTSIDLEGRGVQVKYNEQRFQFITLICLTGISIAVFGSYLTRTTESLVVAYSGLFFQVFGVLLSLPLLLKIALFILGKVSESLSNMPMLITLATLSSGKMVASVAIACLCLVLSVGQGIGHIVLSLNVGIEEWVDVNFEADAYLSRSGAKQHKSFNDLERARIQENDLVSATSAGTKIVTDSRYGTIDVLALDLPYGFDGFSFISGSPDFDEYEKSTFCLVSESFSVMSDITVGDSLFLHTNSGEVEFEVSGIFKDYRPGNGLVSISMQQYREKWGDGTIKSIGVFSKEPLSETVLNDLLEQTGLEETTFIITSEIKALVNKTLSRTLYVMEAVKIGIVLVGMLGVVGCLSILVLSKASDYNFFWQIGLSRPEIRTSIVYVSALLATLSILISIPLGVLIAKNVVDVVNILSFGWKIGFVYNSSSILFSIVFAFLATIVACYIALKKTLGQIKSTSSVEFLSEDAVRI